MRYLIVACAFLSGCGTMSELISADSNAAIDRRAQRLANTYCAQPLAVREVDSRPRINKAIAPHVVKMDCYGDPANPIVSE